MLYHFESQNRERSVATDEIDLFRRRWPRLLNEDPYYSVNLDRRPPDFKMTLEDHGPGTYDGADVLAHLAATAIKPNHQWPSFIHRMMSSFRGLWPHRQDRSIAEGDVLWGHAAPSHARGLGFFPAGRLVGVLHAVLRGAPWP